jgi:two-component system chemotaxis response regulator CheB
MKECPTPVIMVSALTKEGAKVTLKALQLGAVDLITKPLGSIPLDFHKVGEELVAKFKAAAKVKPRPLLPLPVIPRQVTLTTYKFKDWAAVIIAASTGGPATIRYLLSQLSYDLPAAILLVQHMPNGFTKFFADNLNQILSLLVHEAQDGEEIVFGKVYLAPAGFRLLVERSNCLRLDLPPPLHNVRPAADKTFDSAAHVYRKMHWSCHDRYGQW